MDETFDEAIEKAGGFAAWHKGRRAAKLQFTELAAAAVGTASVDPVAKRTLAGAEQILAHEFNLLGSGPFTPSDPTRNDREGYRPIDWFIDPVRGLRFPSDIPHKAWSLLEMRPGNADIKYPWELARCQHFLTLAQAYRLSGDERYATELVAQCEDFVDANPIGIGINWTCTMDVALRAANWCFALNLVSECDEISASSWQEIYRHLFATGGFIVENLENNYEVTSNHFLSNVVGLHILSAEFQDMAIATRWDSACRNALEEEIISQVLNDGADYESSIPYHRLVCELFLGSWRLAQIQGAPLSDRYRARLTSMINFLAAVLRPDGQLPTIGDTDDGRLIIATDYTSWARDDGRHLLAPAAVALEQPQWLAHVSKEAAWEATWWGFSNNEFDQYALTIQAGEPRQPCEELFPDAGIVVSSSPYHGSYLLISNGNVGTQGFGNHKHNDLLSFEYYDCSALLIVDPGSYVYTGDFEQRNAFRSTARHNTIVIDNVEQNSFCPEYLFRMFEKASPKHLDFSPTGNGVRYCGSHDGYLKQLEDGVTHQRAFAHYFDTGRLEINDQLTGTGEHTIVSSFHFAPEVTIEIIHDERSAILSRDGHKWRLLWSDEQLDPNLACVSVSPSYGVIRPSRALVLHRHAVLANGYALTVALTRETLSG